MARRRMIDPGIYGSRQFCDLAGNKPHPQVTYIGLITHADDYGIIDLDVAWLRSMIYPRSSCSVAVVQRHIRAIAEAGLIIIYAVDGKPYAIHPNWLEYQKLEHPGRPRHPIPPREILAICSPITRERIVNEYAKYAASDSTKEKGREGKGK